MVLLDLSLPGASGIECARELKRHRTEIHLLILTVHANHDKIFESLKAGSCGYLLKNIPIAQIVGAIQELVAGGSPMIPPIARKVAQYFQALPSAHDAHSALTDREQEVLGLVTRGRKNTAIAHELRLSPQTVDNRIRHIYEKLQVHSRAETAAKYLAR